MRLSTHLSERLRENVTCCFFVNLEYTLSANNSSLIIISVLMHPKSNGIIKNEIAPLKTAILFFINQLKK